MFVNAQFVDKAGKPIAGAEVDIWHSSTEGFYENQDPVQADMNLRGKFTTDKDGRIAFRSIKPAGYPIPIDGPTGDLLRAQGRHNMRPAHLHFLVTKDGFKTLISQIYVQDDKFIDTDVQFGVTAPLIGNYVRHENEPAPAADVKGPWYSLDYTFTMEPGTTKLPRPPITGKAKGERPTNSAFGVGRSASYRTAACTDAARLPEQDRALFRGADAARVRIDLLRLGIGALDRRPRLDRVEPALHVREVLDLLVLALVRSRPRDSSPCRRSNTRPRDRGGRRAACSARRRAGSPRCGSGRSRRGSSRPRSC